MNKLISISLVFVLFLSSCFLINKESLTDRQVTNYINAYNAIKKVEPKLTNEADLKNNNALESYKRYEDVIKKKGFKDFQEFVFVTQKIMWAFSILQSDVYMQKMKELESTGMEQFQELLNNPNVPDSAKEEAKKVIEQNKKMVEKNKKWSDMVLDFVNNQTDKDSLEVVKNHFKEIENCLKSY